MIHIRRPRNTFLISECQTNVHRSKVKSKNYLLNVIVGAWLFEPLLFIEWGCQVWKESSRKFSIGSARGVRLRNSHLLYQFCASNCSENIEGIKIFHLKRSMQNRRGNSARLHVYPNMTRLFSCNVVSIYILWWERKIQGFGMVCSCKFLITLKGVAKCNLDTLCLFSCVKIYFRNFKEFFKLFTFEFSWTSCNPWPEKLM